MKIGIVGFGKMGKMVLEVAQKRSHDVCGIIDPNSHDATNTELTQNDNAEVYIIFSTPESVMSIIDRALEFKKNIVVGTTGWTNRLLEIQKKAENAGVGFLWASNFSPAVQMFFRIAREAAKMSNKLPEFDAAIWEAHHRHKLDSPSGTALTLGKILLQELDGKSQILFDRPAEKIRKSDLHVTSLRVGEIPGTHAVIFDSPSEMVEVKCTSRNRSGFALGAVLAAEWLYKKKGFFCFDDVFDDILKENQKKHLP